jgi:arsenate reductase (thioredoxin)
MDARNILVLCTGNSARSIFGEALITHHGQGRLRGFSAGSHPKGAVHPLALETLARHGVPLPDARSKSWDEFAAPGAPPIDLIITVCDQAAAETCPVWPGHPATAHWGIPDPAAVAGPIETQRRAFELAFLTLDARVRLLVALPVDRLDRLKLGREAQAIATSTPPHAG